MQKDAAAAVSSVLPSFGLAGAGVEVLGQGLINQTWLVRDGPRRFVLQQVNEIFPVAINANIDTLTRHLEARGLQTARIVPSETGEACVQTVDGIFRLLTFIDGESHNRFQTAAQARSAGALLAKFHRAVADLEMDFANERLGVHDTARHLGNLRSALTIHRDHHRYAAIAPLAEEILEAAAALPELPPMADRIVHGDPKINNIIFARGSDEALCWIDLDTISRMPLPLELGDALRSWCNQAGEDQRNANLSLELFTASLEGYWSGARDWIDAEEWQAIVPAVRTITVELAARFCADALQECYFGWDASRFASRGEHNEVRAAGQLALARELAGQADRLGDAARAVST